MRRLAPGPVRLCTLLAFSALAVPASAQPESGTVFIGAGALASMERSSRSSSLGTSDNRDGTAAGGALQIGVYLTPRVSARFEWSMTDWLEYRNDGGIYPLYAAAGPGPGPGPGPGRGILSPGMEGRVGPTLAESLIAPYGVRGRARSKAGFALLGYHLGSRRASVEVMGGMGWIAKTTRTSYDFGIAQPLINLLPDALPVRGGESRYTDYQTVGVAGLDATVALTDHAAVVPQLRVFASGGDLSLRPGVGIRWTF